MQTSMRNAEIDYAFEFTHEVFEKMQSAGELHVLIPEDHVGDLEYVDVSGKVYCKVKRLFDIFVSLFAVVKVQKAGNQTLWSLIHLLFLVFFRYLISQSEIHILSAIRLPVLTLFSQMPDISVIFRNRTVG